MTTIYVVTSGDYSDYQIHGVFSTAAKAQAFIDHEREQMWGAAEIEQWTLDEYCDPVERGLRCYYVSFLNIRQSAAQASLSPAQSPFESVNKPDRTGVRSYVTYLWAQDEAAALKIANERRIQYLLNEELNKA